MQTTVRMSRATAIVAALVVCAGMFAARSAKAQCPNIQVVNTTGAEVNLCLQDDTGVGTCETVPAMSPGQDPISFPPCSPAGVRDIDGRFYPFNPGPSCFGCSPCITLPKPTGTQCAQVCYDPTCCTVWIFPCSGSCPQ